jgi:hypothetical protein
MNLGWRYLGVAVAMVLMASGLPAISRADSVPIRANVPESLREFSGIQPVTFGVPFAQGVLRVGDSVRVVDAAGARKPAQTEVTATWTQGGQDVRWLLVDTQVELKQGQAKELFLEWGGQAAGPDVVAGLKVTSSDGAIVIDSGVRRFKLAENGAGLGSFALRDGGQRLFHAVPDGGVELEHQGSVRVTAKLAGRYVDEAGASIAQYITRVRYYAGAPFIRVYHTMIWLADDNTQIGELSFAPQLQAGEYGSGASVGLDGQAAQPRAGTRIDLRQVDWDRVTGDVTGRQLDGWLQTRGASGSLTVAVRWPWQQFPLGLGAGERGEPVVRLIGPTQPMSLKPMDVAVEGVKQNVPSWNLRIFKGGTPGSDVIHNGPPALPNLTPRGVAKTWEMLLWFGDEANPAPPAQVINAAAQHPVLACADPAFAVRAELPSPAGPVDDQTFPRIESALRDAFAFYTRELPEEGDFGLWNYGDLQWYWSGSGVPIYRYWMNLGKGWSILPWALWLRSGERQYWENGEANSRHAMDVDMCHVPGWGRDPRDFRLRGGQYHYSALHWGYGPEVFTYYVDSEFLPYCWYMTGYERAREVMLEHAEAMARWQDREAWLNHFRADLRTRAGRHLYVMLKNICVLYEATWDPRLRDLAAEVLELMRQSQFEDGNFPHVKTNHYLDEPLNIAVRVFGWEQLDPMLTRWHASLGDPLMASPGGGMGGPMSLWSAVTLWRRGGDDRLLDVAARMMRTQALTVDDSSTIWRGINSVPGHEAGPALRDWPIVMGALRDRPELAKQSTGLPMPGFHSRLPSPSAPGDEGWALRHVALALDSDDQPITLTIRWIDGTGMCRLRLIAPDQSVAATLEQDVAARALSEDPRQTRLAIPSDSQRGVYALVIDVKGRDDFGPSLSVHSSTGKLVHVMPSGWRNFNAPQHAGEFWVMPKPGQTAMVSWVQGDEVRGRHVVLDEQGRILAATRVTGSRTPAKAKNPASYAFALPVAQPLQWTAPAQPTLVRVVLSNEGKWNRWYQLEGLSPYIAATADQWFDPLAHPHPDLDSYK